MMQREENSGPAVRRMSLVRRDDLGAIVREAVARALDPLDVPSRRAVARALEVELASLLTLRGRSVRGWSRTEFLAEMERARADLLRRRMEAETQLGDLGGGLGRLADATGSGTDDTRVDQLERRIKKLTRSLETTEDALRRVSLLSEHDPGIASIFRTVQGLTVEDPAWENKQSLLGAIFEANLELQGQRPSQSLSSAA